MQEEELKKIEVKDIRKERSVGLVINNFYTLLTIVIMSVVILWYVNYILPEQEEAKQREIHKQEQLQKLQEQKAKREAQIKLSKKLNSKDYNGSK
jgi:Mg2+/citrate symporter